MKSKLTLVIALRRYWRVSRDSEVWSPLKAL